MVPRLRLARGFHQLFNGHPLSALQYNLFIPLVLVAVLTAWWSWFRSGRGHPRVQAPSWTIRATAVGLPAALLVYGVLRNIPFSRRSPHWHPDPRRPVSDGGRSQTVVAGSAGGASPAPPPVSVEVASVLAGGGLVTTGCVTTGVVVAGVVATGTEVRGTVVAVAVAVAGTVVAVVFLGATVTVALQAGRRGSCC